jgi:hypothetical protein
MAAVSLMAWTASIIAHCITEILAGWEAAPYSYALPGSIDALRGDLADGGQVVGRLDPAALGYTGALQSRATSFTVTVWEVFGIHLHLVWITKYRRLA